MTDTYEELKIRIQALHREGLIPSTMSRDQRIDFVYGNTKLENESITREMVIAATAEATGELP